MKKEDPSKTVWCFPENNANGIKNPGKQRKFWNNNVTIGYSISTSILLTSWCINLSQLMVTLNLVIEQ